MRRVDTAGPELLLANGSMHGVRGVMSTRAGGVGTAPFESLNLGAAVGDAAEAVAENRRRFAARLGATPVYLTQVHGTVVVRLGAADARPGAPIRTADASITTEHGIACTVLVADCLPVLLAAPDGRAVGAAHAGWRGLAHGVLEATLAALVEAAACRVDDVQAWLGACIGPRAFEVGPEVLRAFGVDPARSSSTRFVAGRRPDRWLADLQGLAADRLAAAGVRVWGRHPGCSVDDASRFFSFRRDGVTGRMAAAVWIE